MEKFEKVFEDNELPPLNDVVNMQWKAVTGDWWAQVQDGTWYYLDSRYKKEWLPSLYGPL